MRGSKAGVNLTLSFQSIQRGESVASHPRGNALSKRLEISKNGAANVARTSSATWG
jgi:hypothetical protein